MASRTESRALAAIKELEREHPEIRQKGGIHFLQLDLANLESSQAASCAFLEKEERLDILSKFSWPYMYDSRFLITITPISK